MQKFCKREQNHQACLNVLPSAAEFYAKVVVFFQACNEMLVGVLAKVRCPIFHLITYCSLTRFPFDSHINIMQVWGKFKRPILSQISQIYADKRQLSTA
jgi:hypothetical protein